MGSWARRSVAWGRGRENNRSDLISLSEIDQEGLDQGFRLLFFGRDFSRLIKDTDTDRAVISQDGRKESRR